MLKIKDNIDLEELEKYGFVKNVNGQYIKIKEIDKRNIYSIYVTSSHRYLQIRLFDGGIIASSLQTTIYGLTKDGLVEEESEE